MAPTQAIKEHDDGTLTLRFRSGALAEVRRWVMAYGSHAQVIGSADLRAEVATEVAAMAARYGQSTKLLTDEQ